MNNFLNFFIENKNHKTEIKVHNPYDLLENLKIYGCIEEELTIEDLERIYLNSETEYRIILDSIQDYLDILVEKHLEKYPNDEEFLSEDEITQYCYLKDSFPLMTQSMDIICYY